MAILMPRFSASAQNGVKASAKRGMFSLMDIGMFLPANVQTTSTSIRVASSITL